MKKMVWLIAAAVCAWGQTAERKPAEDVYKNITALKGTPADQLGATMQMMAASLGVNCEFCHVPGKMDADDKGEKKTARAMIAMTMAINKDSFRGQTQVSCYSCHRGSARPVAIPPVMDSDARPAAQAPSAPAGPRPTAAAVLEKYVDAIGGEAAVKKVTSREMTGKIITGGNESPITVLTKAPNQRITITKTANGESYTAFDGKSGWMGSTGRPARDMSPDESASSAVDAEFYLGLTLPKMYQRVSVGRPDRIGDVDCVVLQASAPGKPNLRLYFDAKTGLLVRMVRYTETPVGRMPVQIDYADYRGSDGVKVPYRWTLSRPNGRFTIQVTEMKSNVNLPDEKFAKR